MELLFTLLGPAEQIAAPRGNQHGEGKNTIPMYHPTCCPHTWNLCFKMSLGTLNKDLPVYICNCNRTITKNYHLWTYDPAHTLTQSKGALLQEPALPEVHVKGIYTRAFLDAASSPWNPSPQGLHLSPSLHKPVNILWKLFKLLMFYHYYFSILIVVSHCDCFIEKWHTNLPNKETNKGEDKPGQVTGPRMSGCWELASPFAARRKLCTSCPVMKIERGRTLRRYA